MKFRRKIYGACSSSSDCPNMFPLLQWCLPLAIAQHFHRTLIGNAQGAPQHFSDGSEVRRDRACESFRGACIWTVSNS